jgi:hypothetical protein
VGGDFLVAEMQKPSNNHRRRVGRIAGIIRTMKPSDSATGEITPMDLDEAIVTKLLVARNESEYVENSVTEFDAELPQAQRLMEHFQRGGQP